MSVNDDKNYKGEFITISKSIEAKQDEIVAIQIQILTSVNEEMKVHSVIQDDKKVKINELLDQLDEMIKSIDDEINKLKCKTLDEIQHFTDSEINIISKYFGSAEETIFPIKAFSRIIRNRVKS